MLLEDEKKNCILRYYSIEYNRNKDFHNRMSRIYEEAYLCLYACHFWVV